MQADEYFLGKQRIKGTQKVSKKALEAYFQQQPNTTWLGIPWKLWIYSVGQDSFDKKTIQQRIARTETRFAAKIALAGDDLGKVERLEQKRAKKIQAYTKRLQKGNLLMRNGEPPVIYSPQQRELTEQNLLVYLQSKGYFEAQVSSIIKLRNRRASITYHIQENSPHLIGVLRLNTDDSAIEQLLQAHQQQSLLKAGDAYDQEVLREERERIYELLSNHGYFDFDRQYIWFNVDATAADNTVAIETVIGTPVDGQIHPVYQIAQVTWDVEEERPEEASHEETASHSGIIFRNLRPQFKPYVLAKKLLLYPPQLYSKQDLLEARRHLARLGMFKYINITYDVVGPGRLIPYIHTSPVDRFQLTGELGLQVSQWLPTVFCKLSLAGKNLFGRLETLKLGAQ
ncbi:MAG: POTRA domain-containing protein, partial [Bacteroidota bacterium]